MSHRQRPGYDEDEYAGEDPEAYDAAADEEWADEGTLADDHVLDTPLLPEEEGEPLPTPAGRGMRQPTARNGTRQAAAAPPRPPAARPARYAALPPRGGRAAAPAYRSGRRAARPPARGVRVSPTQRGAAYAAGRPSWLMPAALAAVALLILLGGFIFLGNAGQSATIAPDAQATANARNAVMAPVVGNAGANFNISGGPPGVAATINGKPIAVNDWLDRLQAAKQDYGDQFQLNFSGDVGKRMEDVLGFDVLDQMINFEVLMQQARKESLIPNPTQVQQRYDDIRTSTAQQKQTWEQFLNTQHMSDQEFRQNIVDAFTYIVIANNHTTQGKNDDEKAQLLAQYICSTRTKYDVKVYVHFIVPQAPCSSADAVPGGPPANLTITVPAGQPTPVETGGPPLINPPTQAPIVAPTKQP